MPKSFACVRLAGAIALLLFLVVPLSYRIVPAWSLRLIDSAGVPQAGVAAAQTWRHPLFHPEAAAETQRSDAQGRVAFAERAAWSNGLTILYRIVGNIVAAGVNATFGPDVRVHAGNSDAFDGSDFYVPSLPLPETMVLRRHGICPADDPLRPRPAAAGA